LLLSAERTISLPDNETAIVTMTSGMPWIGKTHWSFDAPEGWKWAVRIPKPNYAEDIDVSESYSEEHGFLSISLASSSTLIQTMSLPVRLISPHPATGQDTLAVSRGPIVYTAESYDNEILDSKHPHLAQIGIPENERFDEEQLEVEGIPIVTLTSRGEVYVLSRWEEDEAYRVAGKRSVREWTSTGHKLSLVPWFARANRGGAGRVRTAFLRVSRGEK